MWSAPEIQLRESPGFNRCLGTFFPKRYRVGWLGHFNKWSRVLSALSLYRSPVPRSCPLGTALGQHNLVSHSKFQHTKPSRNPQKIYGRGPLREKKDLNDGLNCTFDLEAADARSNSRLIDDFFSDFKKKKTYNVPSVSVAHLHSPTPDFNAPNVVF